MNAIRYGVLLLLGGFFAATAAHAQGANSRTIAIVEDAGLEFGSFVAPASGGTVTLLPDGTRTAVAVIPIGSDPFGAARFTVTIDSSNPHYIISLPAAVTLTAPGGASMTVDQIVSDPADAGFVQPPGRVQTLTVGGRLNVGVSQPAGTYTGYIPVIVNLGG